MKRQGQKVVFRVGKDEISAYPGENLLDVLRAHGHEVPSLCHMEGLSPWGACRLCLVEVENNSKRKLVTSCNYPVMEGITVYLDTDKVQRNRRMVLRLLQSMAPDSTKLRELATKYEVAEQSFTGRADAQGCIKCGLCVRICREVVHASALTMAGRGRDKHLVTHPFGEFPDDCIGCGACAWVCPTDAISMEDQFVKLKGDAWGKSRPCRYALMGLAPGSICENNYECSSCQVDQSMIDRAGGRHPAILLLEKKGVHDES